MKHILLTLPVPLIASLLLSGCAQYVAVEAGLAVARAVAEEVEKSDSKQPSQIAELNRDDRYICSMAVVNNAGRLSWSTDRSRRQYVEEAKSRGLSCPDPSSLPRAGVVSNSSRTNAIGPVAGSKDKTSVENNVARASAMTDTNLCSAAIWRGEWDMRPTYLPFVDEAKRRGLRCGIADPSRNQLAHTSNRIFLHDSDRSIDVDFDKRVIRLQDKTQYFRTVLTVVKHTGSVRALVIPESSGNCGNSYDKLKPKMVLVKARVTANEFIEINDFNVLELPQKYIDGYSYSSLNFYVTEPSSRWWACSSLSGFGSSERNLLAAHFSTHSSSISTDESLPIRNGLASVSDADICVRATLNGQWDTRPIFAESVREAQRRGLDCSSSNSDSSLKSVDKAEIRALKERLARLESEKDSKQLAISQDTQPPSILINSADSDGARGIISGLATDNTGIAEVLIDGQVAAVDSSGRFTSSTFIPSGGINVQITAYDLKGLSTTETVRLERSEYKQSVSRLAAVNPLVGPKQKPSRDRAALIIGLEQYAGAPPAEYASRDAQMFADYAREKLGIAPENIKVLTDSEATRSGLLRALKVWLPQAVQPNKTDLYVFYAGHGMASDDGESAYIVPYGADTLLLEDTAISRERFYEEIGAAKPRTATFFFDNCYAGTTRSEERLLAQRPLSIRVQESPVPDNYLIFTAGESNQTAGVLDDVQHGRFSYFIFKGLEGEADANADGKISAGELHAYVRESVGRFSAGAQTPTMLGDGSRWVLQ